MKTTFKKSILFSTLIFIFCSLTSFGLQKNDSLYVIEIDGRVIIPKTDDAKSYKIELLYHNTLVDSGHVVDNESFLLKIQKDAWYTIRIIKDGYFPLVVSINTSLPGYNSDSHKFHFDTELIQANYANIQDQEALDFPIAIIAFNPTAGSFLPVKAYSKNIKKSLFEQQVIKESYANN